MAHALTDEKTAEADADEGSPQVLDAVLSSRALIPSLGLVAAAALLFIAYAAYSYLDADCYAEMRKTGLVAETAELFDDAGRRLTRLRKGTASVPKWGNREFQDSIRGAQAIVSDGRQALKEMEPLSALDAIVDLQKEIARAKALATNRVNFILGHQDPADYDAFEKYRLEGKMLVATVGELDAALEALGNRSHQLPSACRW